VAESLTLRIRRECYKKIMRMPISYFDIPENGPGGLSSRLAADAQKVNSLTSNVVGVLIQNLSTALVGIIIAFVYCWQLTLVALACFPGMIAAGMMRA